MTNLIPFKVECMRLPVTETVRFYDGTEHQGYKLPSGKGILWSREYTESEFEMTNNVWTVVGVDKEKYGDDVEMDRFLLTRPGEIARWWPRVLCRVLESPVHS